MDQIGFRGRGWVFGPADSPVQLTDPIVGEVCAEQFTITDRGGCDHHPVDAASPEGRLMLTSFVWPFDVHRHERLAGALSLAAEHPVQVDQASAGGWLIDRLARPAEGGLPVVWHSITQLYWPAEEPVVKSVLARYGARQPLARISLEFASDDDSSRMPELRTTLWSPGTEPRHRRLGTAHHHGVPVRLAGTCPAG